MKYLKAFLAEIQSAENTKGTVPAKPSKPPFAGFAGAVNKEAKASATVLMGLQPGEVQNILAIWDKFFGLHLSQDRVMTHLLELRKWQDRRPEKEPKNNNGD